MVGDENAGFQNVRSVAEEDVWKAYMYCHAVRNSMHGMCETWMTKALGDSRAQELLKSGYGRMYHVVRRGQRQQTAGDPVEGGVQAVADAARRGREYSKLSY